VFSKKIAGPGGLPVGTSGKVLVLLSGGFDSIAASYLLAKRGASVDFLHFHVFPNKEGVLKSKMPEIWSGLKKFTFSKKVFLSSYSPFQMKVLDLKRREEKLELVIFRRVMVRVAAEIAKENGYQALVLGDSLGQVASQTMENIVAVDKAVELPIFRPLIGSDKMEVVDLVRKIDLERVATVAYKDCCSIVSTRPSTKANLEKVLVLEKKLEIEKVVKEMIAKVEKIGI